MKEGEAILPLVGIRVYCNDTQECARFLSRVFDASPIDSASETAVELFPSSGAAIKLHVCDAAGTQRETTLTDPDRNAVITTAASATDGPAPVRLRVPSPMQVAIKTRRFSAITAFYTSIGLMPTRRSGRSAELRGRDNILEVFDAASLHPDWGVQPVVAGFETTSFDASLARCQEFASPGEPAVFRESWGSVAYLIDPAGVTWHLWQRA